MNEVLSPNYNAILTQQISSVASFKDPSGQTS